MPLTRFHINFVGDVMLGRLIDQLLPTHVHCPEEARHVEQFVVGNPQLRDYSFASPWGNALPLFHSAHLNLINLETSATNHPSPWPNKVFNYRMHPENIQCLREASISYTSLANNHTLDFSSPGLLETVRTVKAAGIAFAGAGETDEEARQPAVLYLQEGDEKLLVHVHSAADHPSEWAAVPNFHLIDYRPDTRTRLKALLTSTSSIPCFKIFSVHWGPNYAWMPSDEIQSLARYLIDECGVDLVHGHSSHHVQGVEVYKGRLIIYGCGDFVDDYALNATYRNDLSAVWRVGLERVEEGGRTKLKIRNLEVFPSCIKRFQASLLGRNDSDHRWLHKKLEELSKGFGTEVERTLGEEDQIVINVN